MNVRFVCLSTGWIKPGLRGPCRVFSMFNNQVHLFLSTAAFSEPYYHNLNRKHLTEGQSQWKYSFQCVRIGSVNILTFHNYAQS